MEHIVKRKGKLEKFNAKKIYGSAYAACLNCHMNRKECGKTANEVSNGIKRWIKAREKVTSDQIFKQVVKELGKYSKDAAFMFETHRDLS